MAIDLQMQERSKLWEIDKMELRSRLDFERDEKKRQQVLDQYEASIKYINDSDLFDEQQKERLVFSAKLRASKVDIPGLSRILFPEAYQKPGVLSLLGEPGEVSGVADPLGLDIAAPDSTPEQTQQTQLAVQNKLRVISPDGDEEIIEASEWPAKKAQGYLLADIVELRERKTMAEVQRKLEIGEYGF